MSSALPSPEAIASRMALAAFGVLGVCALLVLGALFGMLPVLQAQRSAAAIQIGVVTLTCFAGLLFAAVLSLRETEGVYRRLARREKGEAPPPPDQAVRALYVGPGRSIAAVTVLLAAVLLVDGSGLFTITSIDTGGRVALCLLIFGVYQSGLFFIGQIWRSLLWRWLTRLPASDVHLDTDQTLARRFALRLISATVLLACAVLSVALAYLTSMESSTDLTLYWVGAIGAAAFGVLLAGGLGLLLGRRIAADVVELTEYVEHFTEGFGWSSGEYALGPDVDHLRTRLADDLASRIHDLAEKYGEMAAAEADARQRIEDTQRIKTRFMAFMSHDLRSPLNSITGFADILAQGMDGPLNADQQESVGAIRKSGQELLRLVTDIVDSARLEAGRLPLARSHVDCPTLLREAIAQARELDSARRVDFKLDVDRALPMLWVDQERFLQALTGVLFHVVRMVGQGTIVLRASVVERGALLDGAYVQLDVGAAELPAEDSQRIFLAFREIRRPSGGRVSGLGLGLFLARSLVAAHGGDLVYETLEGARFTFAVPLLGDDETEEEP